MKRIRFDDTAEKTFEYPSEQSMIEEWIDGDEDEEEEEGQIELSSSLMHTPGISGSTGINTIAVLFTPAILYPLIQRFSTCGPVVREQVWNKPIQHVISAGALGRSIAFCN